MTETKYENYCIALCCVIVVAVIITIDVSLLTTIRQIFV